MRVTVLLAWLVACLLAYGAAQPFVRHNPVAPRFLGGAARIAGVRRRVLGTPLRRDALILANHLSWLDILNLAPETGTAFVAKSDLARVPLVGWLCSLNETVFVERSARLEVGEQVDAVRAALQTGRPVTLFPEGTTGDGAALLPFKTAMLQSLDPAPEGICVQPVVLDYGAATDGIAWVGEESGLSNALRILARPGRILLTMRFLEPLPLPLPAGRKAIAAEVRRCMEAAVSR